MRICGPRFGYRPEMLGATFTTAPTSHDTSASALTRSRSTWSITAMSRLQPLGQVLGAAVEPGGGAHPGPAVLAAPAEREDAPRQLPAY